MSASIRVLFVGEAAASLAESLDTGISRIEALAASTPSDALHRLADSRVDCLVTDSVDLSIDGEQFLERLGTDHPSLPVLLYADEVPGSRLQSGYERGLTEFIPSTADTPDHEVLRNRIIRAVADQRSVLDRLERVLLSCNRELAHATSRADVETTVCERLVDAGVYTAAWIARYDADARQITPQDGAGIDELPAETTVPAAAAEAESPLATVALSGTIRTLSSEDGTDGKYWPAGVPSETTHSGALVPLAFDGTVHGILAVFSDRPDAFGKRERELLRELGESIGHIYSFIDLSDRYARLLEHVPIDALGESDSEAGYFERVVDDITDQQQNLQELANAKARFEALFEQSPDMILVHDGDGKISAVNQRVCEKLGYDREELRGTQAAELDPTVETESLLETLEGIEAGDSPMFDGVYRTKDGMTFPVEVHVTPLANVENEYLVIARDVSTRRERERELELRRQELQRQNDRLEEFVDVLSHDIPNHLNVAQTRLDVARQREDFDQLSHVETAHDRIETIIQDMKRMVKQGREVEETSWLGLSEIARPCWDNCRGDWGGESLTVEPDGRIQADESRLKQLFENLFWNASEHAGEDVNITIGMLDDGFYVEDDGPGIPEADRQMVLQPGYSTAEEGHSGFGLTLVREIAHAHDWNVSITESAEGGARFIFTGVTVDS